MKILRYSITHSIMFTGYELVKHYLRGCEENTVHSLQRIFPPPQNDGHDDNISLSPSTSSYSLLVSVSNVFLAGSIAGLTSYEDTTLFYYS